MKLLQTMYCIATITGDVVFERGTKKDGTSFEYVSCPVCLQVGRFAPKRNSYYRAFREDDSYLFDVTDGATPSSVTEKDGKTIRIFTINDLMAIDPEIIALHTGKDYDSITYRIRICEYDLEGKYYLMRGGKPMFDETNRRKHACFWTTTTRAFAFTRELESLPNPFKAEWQSNVPESRIITNVMNRDLEPERKKVIVVNATEEQGMTADDLLA